MKLSQVSINITTKLVQASGMPTADSRYSPLVLETRIAERRAVERLLAGEELIALAWVWGFGCGLTAIGQPMFYFTTAWPEPVPSGLWMGFPEAHWKMSKSIWESLPLQKKAVLEATEQASRYVARQYYDKWLNSYAPAEADSIWWQDRTRGHKLGMGPVHLEQLRKQSAAKIRNRYLSH